MRKSKNLVKIDLYAMSKFFVRVELGDYKVSKKTKQRKKIEKKNSMSTGLPLNFTKFFLSKSARELRHMNLQMYYTKTQNLPKEKEQRLQKGKKGQRAQKNGPKSHKGKKKDKSGKVIKSMKVARKQLKKRHRSQKNGPKTHKGKKKPKTGNVIKSMKVPRKQLKKKKKSV